MVDGYEIVDGSAPGLYCVRRLSDQQIVGWDMTGLDRARKAAEADRDNPRVDLSALAAQFPGAAHYVAQTEHANGLVTVSRMTTLDISSALAAPSYEETWRHHSRRSPRPNRWRFVSFDGTGWRVEKNAKPRAKQRLARTGYAL